MKQIYMYVVVALLSISSFAQQAYYNDVNLTLTGIPLKDELAVKTINMHTNFLSYADVWEACKVTDLDPNNSNNVVLLYGWENGTDADITNDLSRSKNSNGGNPGDWNREHTYAKSLGTPALGTSGPGSDGHHLRASDVQRNGARGNLLFAAGSGNSATSGGGWYPGDATAGGYDWRGDVARMIMYMYIRYGDQCLPSNVCIGSTNSIDSNMINLLLDWNAADPVSQVEKNRNTYHENTSNTYAQGNRNPFIDEPYLATLIWGGTPAEDIWGIYTTTDTEAPTAPTNLVASNPTANSVDLNWTASTDNTAVTSYDVYVDGSFSVNTNSAATNYTVTGLSSETNYCFTIYAKDAAANTSTVSNQDCSTTLAGASGGSELFFSEYIEGSSNNKVLEIANFTGATVDLSTYTIKKSVNGAATWDTTVYSFPASTQITSGDVYVVANNSTAICTSVIDDLTTSSVFQFNGNDPVGLFKNDVLIDIIGTLGGGSANFAVNTTLVRNPDIMSPSLTYIPSQWTSYPQDTCSDLGSHTVNTLSTIDIDTIKTIRFYPNPLKDNILNVNTTQTLTVEVFNILGKKVIKDTVGANKNYLNLSKLNAGVYLIRFNDSNQTITKKLIRQ